MITANSIIFDLDGTLIDSSDGVVEAVNYSLRKVGSPEQPAEVIKPYIGFPLSTMYPRFSKIPVDELYRHFKDKAASSVVEATQPLPGAEDVLELLYQRGLKLAIGTTKIIRHVDEIITKLGWGKYFAALVGGDQVARVKPEPDAFHLALERMGSKADATVVVGDTINDVLAARKVPLKVIAVSSPYGGRNDLIASRPDLFVESITDIPELIKTS